MHLAVFNDPFLAQNFLPLTYTRSIYELILGTCTLLERLRSGFRAEQTSLITQPYLRDVTAQRHSDHTVNPSSLVDGTILVNGLANPKEVTTLIKLGERHREFKAYTGKTLVAAKLSPSNFTKLLAELREGSNETLGGKMDVHEVSLHNGLLATAIWELLDLNASYLAEDISRFTGRRLNRTPQGVYVRGRVSNIALGKEVVIEGHVVFDTSSGPIMIDKGCKIQAFSRISGPCFLGKGTIVKSALVGSGTTIGDVCRVSGEVADSVILGFSNKAHEGYLGHSYVGEWVNIGAGTCNSDLKNTYGTVRINIGGIRRDTGRIKVGCFLGDGVKTAIGTQIYTGRRIGVHSHVGGVVEDDVPSFTIHLGSEEKGLKELRMASAIEVQRRMMSRRGIEQTEADQKLIEDLYKITAAERKIT